MNKKIIDGVKNVSPNSRISLQHSLLERYCILVNMKLLISSCLCDFYINKLYLFANINVYEKKVKYSQFIVFIF